MAALRALPRVAALAVLLLAGCAGVAPPSSPAAGTASAPATAATAPSSSDTLHLRCDDGSELQVAFAGDEASVSGLPAGEQPLLRDAGGVTPQQSVFASDALRASFGLGPGGREAELLELRSQRRLSCRQR